MFGIKRAFMRFVRYLTDCLVAIALLILVNELASLQVPEYFVPLIAGVIAAIMKFVRDKIKVNLPF